MKRVLLGRLSLVPLVLLLVLPAPAAIAAPPHVPGRTVKDYADSIPLGVLERSVGPKFYRSLIVSPLDDWSTVRAWLVGRRLSNPRVIRPSANAAYNSLAVRFANELEFVVNDRSVTATPSGSALMHLFIYKIADGFMAVSFAYPEAMPGQQPAKLGTVRLSLKKIGGPWTELPSSDQDERGRRLKRIDRMPMDVITSPVR